MVDFRKKTIGPKDAFGAIFLRRREELGLSLGAVAKKTAIPRHYLAALEEGRYNELPGLVYGKSFVRVYGALLRLSVAPLLRAFVDEYTLVCARHRGEAQPLLPQKHMAFITPFRVRMALASVLMVLLGVYFGGEVLRFFRPPHLVVESPHDQLVVGDQEVTVAGRVDPKASLMVNDTVVSNEAGNFSLRMPLDVGVNTIRVRAFRRHGKDTTVVRSVIRSGDGISLK